MQSTGGNRSPITLHRRIPKFPSASEQEVCTTEENSKIEYTYDWYSASVENNDMHGYNMKGKAIIRLNAEKHLHLTHKLLAFYLLR
jgi:hypothetical protein